MCVFYKYHNTLFEFFVSSYCAIKVSNLFVVIWRHLTLFKSINQALESYLKKNSRGRVSDSFSLTNIHIKSIRYPFSTTHIPQCLTRKPRIVTSQMQQIGCLSATTSWRYSIFGLNYPCLEGIPAPGIEPGPPGWKPEILTTRPCGMMVYMEGETKFFSNIYVRLL